MVTPVVSLVLNAAGFAANWAYGNKSRLGPVGWILISICWIMFFTCVMGEWSLALGPFVNLVMQIRNLLKYQRDLKPTHRCTTYRMQYHRIPKPRIRSQKV